MKITDYASVSRRYICISSRLFCRAVVLPVEFNPRVYYAYDAEHGKNGKQINQFHIYCFLLSDSTEKETPATASMTTTASPERISARRFISRSISPAKMIPPNTSFEMSVQYFPISANSAFIFAASLNQQATGQNPAVTDSFCPLHGDGSGNARAVS